MQDFLLNIENKEIFIEMLHHSIDYLFGNRDDQQTLRLCHKYGFNSPDDFMLTIRAIARCYRNACSEGATEADILSEFSNLNSELQNLVLTVLAARRSEIMRFLLREHNAQNHPLVESFDWDVRLIMGDSSFAENERFLATVTFNCKDAAGKNRTLHFQMNTKKLDECIAALEEAVATDPIPATNASVNEKNESKKDGEKSNDAAKETQSNEVIEKIKQLKVEN